MQYSYEAAPELAAQLRARLVPWDFAPLAGADLLNAAGGPAALTTRMLSDFVEDNASAPVTRRSKGTVPAAPVGVPLIAPDDEFSESPAGNCPDEIDQVYGVVPPDAVA